MTFGMVVCFVLWMIWFATGVSAVGKKLERIERAILSQKGNG